MRSRIRVDTNPSQIVHLAGLEPMLSDLRELIAYRDLVLQLVVRDLKVRYKGSVLGFFWSLLNPLVQVATITIVIKFVLRTHIPNYSAYVLAAFLPWMCFQMSALDASDSISKHQDLVKKVYFPREVLPISLTLSNMVHLVLAYAVFFVYLVTIPRAPIYATTLLLPVLMVIQLFLNLGVAFFVSCLNVFYEDTKYIISVLLQVLFYLTPVMYLSEQVYRALPAAHRETLFTIYQLNPLNMLAIAYRKVLLHPYGNVGIVDQPLNWLFLGIAAAVSVLLAAVGYRFFNRRKWIFAEMV